MCFPQSNPYFKPVFNQRTGKMAFSITILTSENQVEIHKEALNCDVDLWYDPALAKLFISSELYYALESIGLKQGNCASDRFSTRVYKCKLV